MKIGELAEKIGMNASAIRFYEKQGLLNTGQRQNNGYRIYDEAAYRQLRLVQLAQNLGFSLDQIRNLATLDEISKDQQVIEALETRFKEVELLQQQLDGQKADILTLIKNIKKGSVSMNCQDIPQSLAKATAS